jgi:molecular chaperone GrpE
MANPNPQPNPHSATKDTAENPATGMAEDSMAYGEDPLSIAEARIAELEAERDAMRDRLMRALADAENSRKRAEKDRRDGLLYGGAKLSRDMLPVYDNLSRALEAATDDTRAAASGLVEGVELTLRELANILEKHGVERINPEPGDMFDPHLHQAMFEAPVPNFTAGQIIQVMTVGFRLHEQLLRPAQVGVSSTPAK